jgi:hypothetical protein
MIDRGQHFERRRDVPSPSGSETLFTSGGGDRAEFTAESDSLANRVILFSDRLEKGRGKASVA